MPVAVLPDFLPHDLAIALAGAERHETSFASSRMVWHAWGDVASPSLALLHGDPRRPWTVDDLAGEVALSRSALADRFTSLIGEAPMWATCARTCMRVCCNCKPLD